MVNDSIKSKNYRRVYDEEQGKYLKIHNQSTEQLLLSDPHSSSVVIQSSHILNEISISQFIDWNDDKMPAFQSTKGFIIGILLLLLMITCNWMIGPLALKIPNNIVYLKAVWRTQTVWIISISIMAVYYLVNKKTFNDFIRDHSGVTLLNHALSGFFLCFWNLGYIVGCSMTITSHATILYSSSSVYLMALAIWTCKPLHKFELIGYGIYLVGAFLMLSDPDASKEGGDGPSYIGDFISFLGAGAGAFSGYYCSKNSKTSHPFVTMANSFFFSSITQLVVMPFLVQDANFYSFDIEKGAFGWASDPFVILIMFGLIAPVTGILGNVGYFFAFTYFPVQIVWGFMLIEPFFGQIVGILLGQDKYPGYFTWLGGIIITAGFLLSIVGEKFKSDKKIQKIRDEISMHELSQIMSESSKLH